MTRTQSDNNDTVFDRLVDGELTAAERQQLLASLDDRAVWGNDSGWRRCALAFLEAQAWGHQLKQMIAHPSSGAAAVAPRRATSPAGVRPGRWFAIAASLLLAFSLGWFTKTPSTSSQQAPSLADVEQEILPLREALPPAISEDAVTLLVRDTNGQNQRLQVPLMEVEQLDDQFASSLPAELREHIRQQGYNVERRRRFAPMFFEQNEQLVPMVVPVDDTRIVPVNRPVF
ncbi:MAG: hypothetical protein ACR2NM_17935 [Bythopirellula sp.]